MLRDGYCDECIGGRRILRCAQRENGISLLILIALFFFSCCHQASAQDQPSKRILILNEVGATYPAINLIDQGIRESLQNSPYHVEFYREYLDTDLFPDPADQARFRNFYVSKYKNRKPDVIIAVGPSAIRFMAEAHEQEFPGVPIVFCLPNAIYQDIQVDPDFTGVKGEVAAGATIAAALQLLPGTKDIVVVGGNGVYDREQLAAVRDQLNGYLDRADISYLTDLAMPALLERLKHLPDHTVVLLTAVGQDAAGTRFKSSTTGPMVAKASNAPVFSLFDVFLNHGEVGGSITKMIDQGRIVGNMTLELLNGARVSDVPIQVSPNTYVFDWRALKRWGLEESRLPSGSIVINREPDPWDVYRPYFIVGGAILLFQALLISALLWQRRRRRRTEIALAVINERLRLALEAGRYAGWDLDVRKGSCLWFGDLQSVLGITVKNDTTPPREFAEYIHPADRGFLSSTVAHARESHTNYRAEFRIALPDAPIRWVAAAGGFYYDHDGIPERMVGLVTDVTNRKRTEEKLQESEERFRVLANAAPVLIWTSDITGQCDYFNKQWLDFTGHPIEQELGEGWADGVHPEDLRGCLATYRNAFQNRIPFEMQYRLRRHDGEYRWILDIGVPRFGQGGSFSGYIGSCIDINERKMAEQAIVSLSGRLIGAHEEERSRIARELHDDYSQRVAVISTELELISMADSDSVRTNQLERIKSQLVELGSQLHSLSHNLHPSSLHLLGLVAGIRSFCREFSEQQNMHLDFAGDGIPRDIPEDVSLALFRIAQEAIRNVKRHSGADRADVMLEWHDGQLHLSVSDNGKGFNPDLRSTDGGIGLKSMEERLRSINGRIEIHSQLGRGTTVEAWVPFKATSSHAA